MSEIIDGLAAEEYHARPELGSTSVKTLAKYPPAVYKYLSEHREHKDAYDVGSMAHSLILEGDDSALTIIDAPDWRTKAAREAKDAARADGKIPLLSKDWGGVRAMRDAVMAHPIAAELLTGHVAERSYFTQLNGVPVKARPDALNNGVAIDLKTTAADPRDIDRQVGTLGYHIQQAHYTAAMESCGESVDDFVFIFVSKAPPHLVRVIRLEPAAVDLGHEEAAHALATYRHCAHTDTWPGYTGIDTIDLPAWVYAAQEDAFIKELVI